MLDWRVIEGICTFSTRCLREHSPKPPYRTRSVNRRDRSEKHGNHLYGVAGERIVEQRSSVYGLRSLRMGCEACTGGEWRERTGAPLYGPWDHPLSSP